MDKEKKAYIDKFSEYIDINDWQQVFGFWYAYQCGEHHLEGIRDATEMAKDNHYTVVKTEYGEGVYGTPDKAKAHKYWIVEWQNDAPGHGSGFDGLMVIYADLEKEMQTIEYTY